MKPPSTATATPQARSADLHIDQALRARLAERLARFPARRIADPTLRRAAVCVLVLDEGDGANLDGIAVPRHWSGAAALLLTRRPDHMRRHAGQWALPGGRCDDGEGPVDTALRELAEETGVQVDPAAVLGTLDDFVTRSGFVITPVVAWAGPVAVVRPDPAEVASVHRIALRDFERPDSPQLEYIAQSDRPVLRLHIGNTSMAAPTAAIVHQFHVLATRDQVVRVAHFEQPVFAWQ